MNARNLTMLLACPIALAMYSSTAKADEVKTNNTNTSVTTFMANKDDQVEKSKVDYNIEINEAKKNNENTTSAKDVINPSVGPAKKDVAKSIVKSDQKDSNLPQKNSSIESPTEVQNNPVSSSRTILNNSREILMPDNRIQYNPFLMNLAVNSNSGTYVFTQNTDIHTQPSFSSPIVATYNVGETVNYYQTKNNEGYTWLVYTSGSGQTHYVPVLQDGSSTSTTPSATNNHKTVWPFAKPYAGYYEEGQQFGMTKFARDGGSKFHDGFDFGDAIYGKRAEIHAITSGKIIYVGNISGLDEFIVEQANDGNQIIYQEFSHSSQDVHVSVGQTVNAGDKIAVMTGFHLHIGVTYKDWETAISHSFDSNGPWINPITYIQSHL